MADTLALLNAVGVNAALAPPAFLAFQSAAQSVPTGFAGLNMTLATPSFDTYGGWSSGSPTRYTAQVPGTYLFIGGVSFATNTSGNRLAQLQKNGSTSGAFATASPALNTANFNAELQAIAFFVMNGTTDYVEIWGYQDSGGALNTVASSTFLAALKIHT
jgi:hypothetical protein